MKHHSSAMYFKFPSKPEREVGSFCWTQKFSINSNQWWCEGLSGAVQGDCQNLKVRELTDKVSLHYRKSSGVKKKKKKENT